MTFRVLVILQIIIVNCPGIVTHTTGQISQDRSPFSPLKQMFGPPLFLYDTHILLSPDNTSKSFNYQLHVYVAFANDILQFVKERQGHFTAEYDLFVSIFDHKGNLIKEKLTSNQISVPTFEQTNDRNLGNRHKIKFDLMPGRYKLTLDLTDRDTQKSLHREKQIQIEAFDLNKISVSEVLFTDKIVFDSLKNIQEIQPNLTRNFTDPKAGCWAYFEIYPSSISASIKFSYSIRDASEQTIIRDEREITADRKVMPYLLDLSKDIKSPGRYKLVVQIEQKNETAIVEAKFSANWIDSKFSKLNIENAIQTLKDFVPEKEYKNIMQASDSSKAAWFKNFWKQRDPTPDTEVNELQDEFYRRVDFVNNQFTINAIDKEGWQTDRGNIYLKYGAPTNVERHQDQLNLPPYEIWYYEKLNRRFYFEDKSGVGDFQLVRME